MADYKTVVSISSTFKQKEFFNSVIREDLPLLIELAAADNVACLKELAVLPFFRNLLHEPYGEDGWTPVLAAAAHATSIDHRALKLLVEYGADLYQNKKD